MPTLCASGKHTLITLANGGYNLAPSSARRHWCVLRAKVNLPHLRLHDLPRTIAEKVYTACGDLRTVQLLLGHTNLNSTFHYLSRTGPRLDALRDALKVANHEDES